MTDFRALCAELVEKLDELNCHYNVPSQSAMIERACAALADEPAAGERASVTGQPNDEELLETLDKATATFPPRHPEAEGLNAVEYPLALELRKARAVLARWGNPAPQPPAEREVGELVAFLRGCADGHYGHGRRGRLMLTRAADLLEQRHPTPVPVSERLQQMEDLAADAVAGLRYIELCHGRLYGVGWDLVYKKADRLKPAHALPISQ